MRGRIRGTGSCIPKHYYRNDDIAKMVDTNDEWIQERTGIIRRHIATEETTSSMAIEAAKRALENAGMTGEEINLILIATVTPNRFIPGIACQVQEAINAKNAAGMDINAACSGFIFAYHTAQAYISSGVFKKILIVGCETLSSIVNWEDRSSCILFGDGAGAIVLEAEEGEAGPFVMHIDGARGSVLLCESRQQKNWQKFEEARETYVKMDGQGVFKFAVKVVPEVIGELLNKADYSKEDIDWFVLHQANKRIIESIAKRMNMDMSKFPTNIEEYGNISSASIPILLDEMNRDGRFKKGQKIVLAGFGAGLSWGAALVEW